MKVFDESTVEWFLWLSREEWQLLHATSFAWEVFGLMPETRNVTAGYRYVIAQLQREHGYEFDGLALDDEGDLWAKTEEPICPENILTIELMRSGMAPDYEVHLKAAIAYAGERIPGFDVEPLRAALAILEKKAAQIREVRPDLPIEVKERIRDSIRARGAYFQASRDLA